MSLAENLLNNMENDFSEYLQEDLEPHIVIDESRIANVPQSLRTIAVTGDKDILTIPFDCARFIDGNDLSTFAIYLNYVLPDGTAGTYIPYLITTIDGDEQYHFDWLIKNNITKQSGKISFAITAIKTKQNDDGESVVDKQWSSIPNGDCSIALGLDISNVPSEEETPDVVAQLSAILERIHGDVDEWIRTVLVQTTGNNTAKAMSQDAVTKELYKKIDKTSISQTTGNSNTDVISQYGVTIALRELEESISKDISEKNEETSVNLNKKISRNSKMIENLDSSLSKVQENSISYSKIIPEGVLPFAEIAKVGGMSYIDAETIKDSPVTEIKSLGVNLFNTNDITRSQNGISWSCVNNIISAFGTSTVGYNSIILKNLKKWTGTYFIKQYDIIEGISIRVEVQGADGSKTLYRNSSFTLDGTERTVYILAQIDSVSVEVNASTKVMLNIGKTAIEYDDYTENTLKFPAEVQAIEGYGEGIPNTTAYNFISFQDNGIKTFNRKLARYVYNGTESFKGGTNGYVYASPTSIYPKKPLAGGSVLINNGYSASLSTDNITIYTSLSASEFMVEIARLYAEGTPLTVLYEIATPEIIDISDILPDDNYIRVEENGMIFAVNQFSQDVPTTIVYRKENSVKKEEDGSINVGDVNLSPDDLRKLLELIK